MRAVRQLHVIAAQVHAPAGRLGWFSYGGAAKVVLAVVLVAMAAGVAAVGFRLRVPVRLRHPGRTARKLMLASWATAIAAYLVCLGSYAHLLIQQHLVHSRPRQPVFPITVGCMIALFFGIMYVGRSLNEEARVGSAFIGAVAAPVVFEFSAGAAVPGGLPRLRADAADLCGLGALRIRLPILPAALCAQRSVEGRGLRRRAQPLLPPARRYFTKYQFSGLRLSVVDSGVAPFRLLVISATRYGALTCHSTGSCFAR